MEKNFIPNHEIQPAKQTPDAIRFDKIIWIVSVIGSILGAYVAFELYKVLEKVMFRPFAIGIVFLVFTVIVYLSVLLVSAYRGNFKDRKWKVVPTLLILAGLLGLSTVFEYIYEMNFFNDQIVYSDPTSYILIIDDSGSMGGNDPNGLRYSAIPKIVADKDDQFQYAVYSFSDGLQLKRALKAKADGDDTFDYEANGGTFMGNALDEIMDGYKKGTLGNVGKHPKILLLTDGAASDLSMSSLAKTVRPYLQENIAISTVALGDFCDEELLQAIADDTGGVFVRVDQVDQIEQAMQNAINNVSNNRFKRTLFTYRYVPTLDWLYTAMRIVFTFILGMIISLLVGFLATNRFEDAKLIITASIITSFLGSLLLEFGINHFYLSTFFMKYLYLILVGMTFVRYVLVKKKAKLPNIDVTKDTKDELMQPVLNKAIVKHIN